MNQRSNLYLRVRVLLYGGDLPPVIDDLTILTPQSSYGTQKAMCEMLINDYTRKGYIDGRSLRLPLFASDQQSKSGSIVFCPVASSAGNQ